MFNRRTTTSADLAAETIQRATACVKAGVKKDATRWGDIATPVGSATQEYVASQPSYIQTLLYVDGLRRLGASAEGRGPDYPFVFGDVRTNGLETAAGFALDNAAIALYESASDPDDADAVCLPGGRIQRLLGVISALELGLLTTDRTKLHSAYTRVCAHMGFGKACDDGVYDCALRTLHMSYYEAIGSSDFKFKLSPEMMDNVLSACRSLKSDTRVGRLVLKMLSKQVARARNELVGQDNKGGTTWDRVSRVMVMLDLPVDLMFE